MMIQETFQRYEKKYLLSAVQYHLLLEKLNGIMKLDQHGKSTVCNIYYDTPDHRLIRASLDKPVYKEKLRLRSYGVPKEDTEVFVELKKKYKGVVYKRRMEMPLKKASEYLSGRRMEGLPSQIGKEVDWFLKFYKELLPSMYISYERLALCGVEGSDLRLTLDCNILWREEELDLKTGVWGNRLLERNQYLMEIKIPGVMPLWMSHLLDELHCYPVSLSKYGAGYRESIRQKNAGEKEREAYYA